MFLSLRSVLIVFVASTVTVSAAVDPTPKPSGVDSVDVVDITNTHNVSDTQYIRDLTVHYANSVGQMPVGAVAELTGQSNDINYGFGGQFVWLVPAYTSDAAAAATSFDLVLSKTPIPGLSDLAAGAGGLYRYLVSRSDPNVHDKLARAVLFRSGGPVQRAPQGWNLLSADLNKSRGKSYLYVAFATLQG